MRISDWSSDVCSSDLRAIAHTAADDRCPVPHCRSCVADPPAAYRGALRRGRRLHTAPDAHWHARGSDRRCGAAMGGLRSDEHTSELQSLMRISYAVFCLKKKNNRIDSAKEQIEVKAKKDTTQT